MSATAGTVFPWRDDALVSGESLYALWNKLAWFAATGPADLLRQCRATDGKYFATPKQLVYAPPANWTRYLQQVTVAPVVRGLRLFEALRIRALLEAAEVPAEWRSPYLRVCDLCIAGGVHLRFHQHMAVARCPIHNRPLISTCTECAHELEQISTTCQKAFTCTNCGYGLLRAEGIRFGFDSAFVELCAHATAECRKWLRRLHAMPIWSWPSVRNVSGLEAIDTDSDPRFLLLAAFATSATDVPSWLRQCRPKGFVACLAKVDPDEIAISRSIRSVPQVADLVVKRIPARKWSPDPWKDGDYADERTASRLYHLTIMRVASCFLRQIGATHHACMNIPSQISGETLENVLLEWQWHILDCCPIAVGFWLWRLQSAARFTDLLVSGPAACAKTMGRVAIGPSSSLLCYAMERSRLHACIVVAHRCRRLWLNTGHAFPALKILDEWMHRSGTLITPHQFGLHFMGADSEVAFVRLDASALIARVACLGDTAFHDWLSDRLGAMTSLRRTKRVGPIETGR
ncbi:hypothetical protein [Metallibacterium scheffleri]